MSRKSRSNVLEGDITRIIAMILIAGAMLAVIVFAVYKAIYTPEKQVKDRISQYTSYYYEEYFYPKTKNSATGDQFEATMRQYAERGVGDGHVQLRQLMLHDGGKFSNDLDFVASYCDLDKTYVEIYPEKPYEKNNYHVNYKYSCNF